MLARHVLHLRLAIVFANNRLAQQILQDVFQSRHANDVLSPWMTVASRGTKIPVQAKPMLVGTILVNNSTVNANTAETDPNHTLPYRSPMSRGT